MQVLCSCHETGRPVEFAGPPGVAAQRLKTCFPDTWVSKAALGPRCGDRELCTEGDGDTMTRCPTSTRRNTLLTNVHAGLHATEEVFP